MSLAFWTNNGDPYSGDGDHDHEMDSMLATEGIVIVAYAFRALTTNLASNGFVYVLYTDPNGNAVTYSEPTYVLNFLGPGDTSSSISNMVAINKKANTPLYVRLTIVGTGIGTSEADGWVTTN